MRKELAKIAGERKKFSATFSRLGKKVNYKGHSEETILLTNIVDLAENKKAADHVWFAFTAGFEKAGIKEGKEGCLVEFEARTKEYKKGYANSRFKIDERKRDFKLSNPTKINLR